MTWYLDQEGICKKGVLDVAPEHRLPEYRLTLDYEGDYELMKRLATELHQGHDDFYLTTGSIIEWLKQNNPL